MATTSSTASNSGSAVMSITRHEMAGADARCGQKNGGLYEDGKAVEHSAENICALTIQGPMMHAYANAMRRTLIGEVPYAAFCPTSRLETRFERNTTLFDDEFLRLRVSMVPLSLGPGRAERRNGVFGWVGGRTPVYHSSKVGTPGGGCAFTAGDLLGEGGTDDGDDLLKPDPLTGHYPMVAKLRTDEQVELCCRPRIDIGRNHTAFSPVGTVGYDILCAESDGGGGAPKAVGIRLTIEANNAPQPTAEQLVYDALYWAARHLHDMKGKISYACERAVLNRTMVPAAIDVVIGDEHDTRGHLLVTELRHLFMNSTLPELKFAGYKVPHPLKKEILVRIQPLDTWAPRAGDDRPLLVRMRLFAEKKLVAAIDKSLSRWERLREQWGKHEANKLGKEPTATVKDIEQ